MRNDKYWENRANERMATYHKNSDEAIRTINNAYDKATEDIEEEIKKIFTRYAVDGVLTPNKAKRYLNQKIPNIILDIMRKYYPKIKNEKIKRWVLSKVNAPAYRARITRLEALKQDIYLKFKQLADVEISVAESKYINTINKAYYSNIYDIQKGIGIGFDIAMMPSKTIETILRNPWSGKHFSQRVWDNTDVLADKVTDVITSGFASGKSMDKMVREIRDNTEYGKYATERLVRTETTYMANAAEIESYKECAIEKYVYIATLDLRTSKECRALDRKVFEVSKGVPGTNLPPMHPHCRSTTKAYIDSDVVKNTKRRARDPETGKTYLVDGNMSYEEWYKKYVVDKYGKDQAEAMQKKLKNKISDTNQHKKYKLIFGDKIPPKIDDFQKLKYNNIKEWEKIKSQKQEVLNSLDYRKSFFGRFGDKEVRQWYIAHDKNIPNLIDRTEDLEKQARKAHSLRNKYRTEARNMMKDQGKRAELDKANPNISFEDLINSKMGRKNMSREEAIQDIVKTATKTNKKVNKSLGLE